jgi:hypothetical protein
MVPLEGVVSAAVELPKPLTAEDQFLVYEEPNAVLKPLKDISNLSTAVFTRRNPVDGNTPAAPAGGVVGNSGGVHHTQPITLKPKPKPKT